MTTLFALELQLSHIYIFFSFNTKWTTNCLLPVHALFDLLSHCSPLTFWQFGLTTCKNLFQGIHFAHQEVPNF